MGMNIGNLRIAKEIMQNKKIKVVLKYDDNNVISYKRKNKKGLLPSNEGAREHPFSSL